MIPNPSDFPKNLDTDDNLFLVHDSLRVRLLEDYIANSNQKSILIEGDETIISRFPTTGIITLTEQCSEIDWQKYLPLIIAGAGVVVVVVGVLLKPRPPLKGRR
jgi:hypothetical protein